MVSTATRSKIWIFIAHGKFFLQEVTSSCCLIIMTLLKYVTHIWTRHDVLGWATNHLGLVFTLELMASISFPFRRQLCSDSPYLQSVDDAISFLNKS